MGARTITRREAMIRMGAAAAGIVAARSLAVAQEERPRSKPNVLFIAVDDLNTRL
jgi:hypothetical protein